MEHVSSNPASASYHHIEGANTSDNKHPHHACACTAAYINTAALTTVHCQQQLAHAVTARAVTAVRPCRSYIRTTGGGTVPHTVGRRAGGFLYPRQVGRARVPHPALPCNIWLLHLLYLLCSSPEAQTERLDRQLCAGIILHCAALVGRSGTEQHPHQHPVCCVGNQHVHVDI